MKKRIRTNRKNTLILKQADIFLTQGSGVISKAIRIFTRNIGEKRTKVNHVGIVVKGGSIKEAVIVEALSKVMKHKLIYRYGVINNKDNNTNTYSKNKIAIYRPINLTQKEIKLIVEKANSYVGRKYGYFKIVMHFLDWLLLETYVFRRLTNEDKYPICSWVVAYSFLAVGKDFGVAPGAASPDDIWDFVQKNKNKYKEVFELDYLTI